MTRSNEQRQKTAADNPGRAGDENTHGKLLRSVAPNLIWGAPAPVPSAASRRLAKPACGCEYRARPAGTRHAGGGMRFMRIGWFKAAREGFVSDEQ
jgi:hypothetical protein